ncbi:MAG: ADP-forming succinate--CoA ligase subunit beta [Thiohalomonadaceae bacterium]
MNLHEFQTKDLLGRYGVAVPAGRVLTDVDGVSTAALELGGDAWMVKAQVHAGGRGKAGGVRKVTGQAALQQAVADLLGNSLLTAQTGATGQPINQVLIEPVCEFVRELYLSLVVDRARERVVVMASSAGGMDIEEVARQMPTKILTVVINPVAGLQPFQSRQVAFALELTGEQIKQMSQLLSALYRVFIESDASLLEINPLVVTAEGDLLALDAKLSVDDNALYRQPALAKLRDATQEDEREYRALQHGLNYVALTGNIGCMVNGAGLAMATMDLIKLQGGAPANFLDVGGGTTAEKVAEAFKLILSDAQVQAILVNIFGGIVRCDLIAEGIIKAVREVGIELPIIVRLAGTNAELGRKLLAESGLSIIAADDLAAAAEQAVLAARGA